MLFSNHSKSNNFGTAVIVGKLHSEYGALVNEFLDEPDRALAMFSQELKHHPNGFAKQYLKDIYYADETREFIRLHIWDAKAKNKCGLENRIHNHRWKFKSYVISGKLEYELYEVHPNGEKFKKLGYTPGTSLEQHVLIYEDSVNMRLKNRVILEAGDCISQNTSEYHKVVARSYPTMSIIWGIQKHVGESVFVMEKGSDTSNVAMFNY